MARTHGRTATAIWSDPDFVTLSEGAQRMYLFLCSQSDLSHAGLVPLRERKWSTKAEKMTAADVQERLDELTRTRYIVVDEDTEEVLIRTFVRNDGVYKQPKVMLRMREDAQQIESPLLRAAFRAELDRLPLDELSDIPGGPNRDQPSTREVVQGVVDTLRADFADAAGYPSPGVSDTHPDTPRVRAGALPHPPSPYPLPPTPAPITNPRAASRTLSADAERAFDEFWDAYAHKVGKGQALTAWKKARAKVEHVVLVRAAMEHADWHRRAQTEARFIPHASTWLNGERWSDERPTPSAAASKPSTTDQRVMEGMALAERLKAEEQAQQTTNLRQIGQAR
jgi:hypothetical protein